MPKQRTIRGDPDEVGEQLKTKRKVRAQDIFSNVVGVDQRRQQLERYATWSEEDFAEIQGSLDEQRAIDEELWR